MPPRPVLLPDFPRHLIAANHANGSGILGGLIKSTIPKGRARRGRKKIRTAGAHL